MPFIEFYKYYESLKQVFWSLYIEGILTQHNMHHNLDIIIYATGYSLDSNWSQLGGKDDTGKKIVTVKRKMKTQNILVRSFYGSFYESTPNFFTFYGPHTNLGHFSIIYMIECQMQLLINVLKIYFETNANGCQG